MFTTFGALSQQCTANTVSHSQVNKFAQFRGDQMSPPKATAELGYDCAKKKHFCYLTTFIIINYRMMILCNLSFPDSTY